MDPYRLGLVATRIHYFQLVARLGSIRQAALVLSIAPSSISRVLKQLEEELGTPLFERVRQRLKLTSAGELMLYHARVSTAELNRASEKINELHGLRRGRVSVSVIESAARGLMPKVLSEFWAHHPEINVDIKVVGSQQASEALAEGDCDLAVAFDVQVPRHVRRIAMVSLPLGVLAPPGSRFASKKHIKLFELSGERVILSDQSLMLGISVEEAFNRAADPRRHRTGDCRRHAGVRSGARSQDRPAALDAAGALGERNAGCRLCLRRTVGARDRAIGRLATLAGWQNSTICVTEIRLASVKFGQIDRKQNNMKNKYRVDVGTQTIENEESVA
jgi:DNA-binding transcriptional LysR family regulator